MPWKPGDSGNPSGAPKRAKIWKDAINRAIKRREESDPHALERLASQLLLKVDEGDVAAIKEFGDRVDGKVAQPIAGEDGEGPAKLVLEVSWKPLSGEQSS